MYNNDEAVKAQVKAERNSILLFFLFSAALAVFAYFTVGKLDDNKIYYGIYVVAVFAIIKYSRIFCFFSPRRRYGIVVSMSDFEEKASITNPGTYADRTGQYTKTEFTLEIRFDNGKQKYYEFEFIGVLKDLKVGDRIAIFRFLKMPVQV